LPQFHSLFAERGVTAAAICHFFQNVLPFAVVDRAGRP